MSSTEFTPGSWWKNQKGYINGMIYVDGKRKHIKQHRYFMEQHIGRSLEPWEDVHHINGIKDDNRIENLQIVPHGDHTRITNTSRTRIRGGKFNISDEERSRRSEAAKERHRDGRLKTPISPNMKALLERESALSKSSGK